MEYSTWDIYQECSWNQCLQKRGRGAALSEESGWNTRLTVASGANRTTQSWPIFDKRAKSFTFAPSITGQRLPLGSVQIPAAEIIFASSANWSLFANSISSSWGYKLSIGKNLDSRSLWASHTQHMVVLNINKLNIVNNSIWSMTNWPWALLSSFF